MQVASSSHMKFASVAPAVALPKAQTTSHLAGPAHDTVSFGNAHHPKFGAWTPKIGNWYPFGQDGFDGNDVRRTLALLALLASGYFGLNSYKEIRYPDTNPITAQQVDESAAGLAGGGAGIVLATQQLLKKDKKRP